jgi:hypothetical protein
MGVCDCLGYLLVDFEEPRHVCLRRRSFGKKIGQRATFDQFHCEEWTAVAEASDFMGRGDAGMLQLAGNACLVQETPHVNCRFAEARPKYLDRQRPVEARILNAQDHAHPASSNLAQDPVPLTQPDHGRELPARRSSRLRGFLIPAYVLCRGFVELVPILLRFIHRFRTPHVAATGGSL